MEWTYNHTLLPFKAIISEILNDQHMEVSDEKALKDSMETLQRLLEDFYKKQHPHMDGIGDLSHSLFYSIAYLYKPSFFYL